MPTVLHTKACVDLNAKEGAFGDTKVGAVPAVEPGDVARQAGSQRGGERKGGENAGTMALRRCISHNTA